MYLKRPHPTWCKCYPFSWFYISVLNSWIHHSYRTKVPLRKGVHVKKKKNRKRNGCMCHLCFLYNYVPFWPISSCWRLLFLLAILFSCLLLLLFNYFKKNFSIVSSCRYFHACLLLAWGIWDAIVIFNKLF